MTGFSIQNIRVDFRRSECAELSIILLLLLATGWMLIPAHWNTIWGDREFTGWVVPIANRFAEGLTLYDEGGHSPMPPLPFVFAFLISAGDGNWLLESTLNYGFQCATLAVIYAGFRRRLPIPVPFWAVLSTAPIFLMLPKTILYDSMAQFFVATCAVSLVSTSERLESFYGDPARKITTKFPIVPFNLFIMPGTLIACLALTKQNTAAGVVIGASLLMLLDRSGPKLLLRFRNLLQLGATTLSAFILIATMLWMFGLISFSGLWVDVFLTGAEPKGGSFVLLTQLKVFSREIAEATIPWAVVAAGLIWLSRPLRLRHAEKQAHRTRKLPSSAYFIAVVTAVSCYALARGQFTGNALADAITNAIQPIAAPRPRFPLPYAIPYIGLFIALGYSAISIFTRYSKSSPGITSIARFTLILFPAAVLHALSARDFRWVYDNNPLIGIAFAALIFACSESLSRLQLKEEFPRQAMAITAGILLAAGMWSCLAPQLRFAAKCTETWPEVPYLNGALMKPESSGLRKLARMVRTGTPAPESDTVLMLPEDPNVMSWFERRRPPVSSSILFVDQYWDRYVDADFERIKNDPPRIIVIGPRKFTQYFNAFFSWDDTRGIDRLIERVERELLPGAYRKIQSQKIEFRGGSDTMDVYLRENG